MKAIIIEQYGGPEKLAIQNLPDPEPKPGHVVIAVKAFGINHAETHMRKGEWAEAAKVSGIECVGVVKACPGGEFNAGQKVAAFMGGMGRTIDGSYAEYTSVPVSNVVAIESELSWAELAAIPESYATAWTCLHRNLELKSGQMLVLRGATSALGQAALNIAAHAGANVIATTRNPDRAPKLTALGARRVELERPDLSRHIAEKRVDAVLDLVGNSTILDSMAMVRRGGRVCLAGFLGGLAPVASFNPLLEMPSSVQFSFFGSFVFGALEFPVSDVPFQEIVDRVAAGEYQAKPARVFRFEEIQDAHRLMESNQANGKIVVSL
ncbi:MAG: zinc-binding dehydrogenase [Acidobacteria bacterium Pan2503]|uniref:Zinc-binding dehydrogenase n=1 Tax=Candidatus Acidiferrum panamense TaxID=2741543 RepID=A0A7V8NMN1_9BACT|nr:zinc-binding dehydrogenase [Candidatus Acidoferrum panamensis]